MYTIFQKGFMVDAAIRVEERCKPVTFGSFLFLDAALTQHLSACL